MNTFAETEKKMIDELSLLDESKFKVLRTEEYLLRAISEPGQSGSPAATAAEKRIWEKFF